VVRASAALDPKRKALWYTADVTWPAAGEREIVHELGVAFAYRYNMASQMNYLNVEWLRRITTPLLVTGPDTRTDEDILHLQYSLIRWFFDAPAAGGIVATGPQVPLGTQLGGTGVSLEDL
jgi:hypothetical protein